MRIHLERSVAKPPTALGVAAVLLLALAGCGSRPELSPRSVVLVTIDTLRADALGIYGNRLGVTPRLDRVGREGVVFEQANAASPNTLPSHVSILTGKWPFHHGVRSNDGYALADDQVTLAERVGEKGFATAAEVASIVLARETGVGQGFASFRDTRSPGVARVETPIEMREAADITDSGIRFLEQNRTGPFLLWLHYYDPHYPYTPPDRFRLRTDDPRWPDEPPEPANWKVRRRAYQGEVAHVDFEVGRLIDALERLGVRARTLLVVTSDHGEGIGEHGEGTHSYFVYQSTIHVPLVLWGPPDLPAGARVVHAVSAIDVAPTILDWLGLVPFEGADRSSLLPLLSGAVAGDERAVYGESVELYQNFGAPALRFVREGFWKYVHKPRPALYDLEHDPGERVDLAAQRSADVERLRSRLGALLSEDGTPAPSARRVVTPKDAAALEALGYVVGDVGPPPSDALESFAAGALDADDLLHDTRLVSQLHVRKNPEADLPVLEDLCARYPRSAPLLTRLLDAQLALGRSDAAIATLRKGVGIAPQNSRFWSNLGELLMKLGRKQEARPVLEKTLEHFPCEPTSQDLLASLYAESSQHAKRAALLERGVAQCEPSPKLLNDLAWVLSTSPEAKLRNGERAVALASRAAQALGDNPMVLDTLAAAQAESGRSEEAKQTMRRALALAAQQALPAASVAVLRDHSDRIAAGQPIRE